MLKSSPPPFKLHAQSAGRGRYHPILRVSSSRRDLCAIGANCPAPFRLVVFFRLTPRCFSPLPTCSRFPETCRHQGRYREVTHRAVSAYGAAHYRPRRLSADCHERAAKACPSCSRRRHYLATALTIGISVARLLDCRWPHWRSWSGRPEGILHERAFRACAPYSLSGSPSDARRGSNGLRESVHATGRQIADKGHRSENAQRRSIGARGPTIRGPLGLLI